MKGLRGLLLLVTMLQVTFATAAEEFKMVKRDENITLYERWMTNTKGEPLREIKAIVEVRSDFDAILRLLTDNSEGKTWNTSASDYKVVGRAADGNWLTYTKYDIPWPFEDQDCLLLFKITQRNDNTAEIAFQEHKDPRFPVNEGVTRISGTKGKWVLENLKNGNVRITYYISTDRSKKIPKWCSDIAVHSNMFKTLTTFKNTLEKK
jgi:hypothetical protein